MTQRIALALQPCDPPPSATSARAGASLHRLFRYAARYHGLLTLICILGIADILLSFAFPFLIGWTVDLVAGHAGWSTAERIHRLQWLIGGGIATGIGYAIVVYGRGHCNVHLGNRIVTELRKDIFDHLQRLSLQFYAKERTGSIMSRLLHDVHQATGLINNGVILVVLDVAKLIVAIVLMFTLSAKLAVASIVVLPIYGLTFAYFNPRVRKASEALHAHYCKISGNVQEQLTGVALIKTYAAEERESAKFEDDVEEHHDYVVKQSHAGHLVGSVSEVLVHLGTTIVIGYGGYLAIKGQLTAGDLTKFIGFLGIMYGPIRRFADLNIIYQTSISAMRRVFRVFDITPKVAERSNPITHPPVLGAVRFDHVKFHYDQESDETRIRLDDDADVAARTPAERRAQKWVLDGLTFEAKPGERVALVGPSGAGKSTVVSLLPRLYDVIDGGITIDGHDIRDYSLKALRTSIGIVQQDSFIFTGTIRDNLAYGRPGATDEQVINAAKAANAHAFITALPKGYDTMLGERGVNLSGGQRQRLSIARALLKDPRILILDEATSALDTESESLVQAALDRLMRGRTCFIIAHRLSTVRNADRIYVMDTGRIVEAGNHDQLLNRGGLYARLVEKQFGKVEEEFVEA